MPVLASISDELFVNLRDTDWGARAGFDQNRLFIGPGVELAQGGRVDVGCLNVFTRRAGQQDLMAYAVAMNLVFTR